MMKLGFAIRESKDWRRRFDEIVDLRQIYLEESVTLDNREDKQVVLAAVDNLCHVISSKVDDLYAEFERQGLY